MVTKQLRWVGWVLAIQSFIFVNSLYAQTDSNATIMQDTVKKVDKPEKSEKPRYEFSGYSALEVGETELAHFSRW